MNKIQQLRELESQQIALLSVMQKSDAHALKCTKLGLSFAETYPDDEAEYVAAREQYNLNEETIQNLQNKIQIEQEAHQFEKPELLGEK